MDEVWEDCKAPHVVVNSTEPGGRFECRNCGHVFMPMLPCSFDVYIEKMGAFINSHKDCELRTKNRLGPAKMPEARDG